MINSLINPPCPCPAGSSGSRFDFWTPAGVMKVLGGQWLMPPSADRASATLTGVSTDSRNVASGQIFIALKGDKFDGHDFVAPVTAQTQVGLVIVHHELTPTTSAVPMLRVPDTLKALQQLAGAYRQVLEQAGATVIAVIGSNGKTTTRHLIHTALSSQRQGTQSPKSFNNHIGVPLTMLAAGLQRESFVVVEVGSNHPGEIADLMKLVRPDILALTSLGQEHMEFFGTLEGVAAEECSAFAMVQPQGTVVLPGDEPTWSLIQPHLGQLSPTVKRYTFGRGNHHTVHLKNFQPTSTGSRVLASLGVQAHELTLPLPGEHNALNALSALLVGQAMGLELSKLAEALASATPAPQRGQLQRYQMGEGVITVLNDSYNANPDSMRAALDMLMVMPEGDRSRKLAVLGDMLELGSQSPDLHRVLGRDLAQRREKLGLVILIGRMSMFTAEALLKEGFPPERLVTFAGWSEDLPMKVCAQWQPGDLVLLKASRGMGLERLLAGLKQE